MDQKISKKWLLGIFLVTLLSTVLIAYAIDIQIDSAVSLNNGQYNNQRKILRNSTGELHVVYNNDTYLYHRSDSTDGSSWSSEHTIIWSDPFALGGYVSMTEVNNELIVVMQNNVTYNSTDNGVTWTVLDATTFSVQPDISDNETNLYVVDFGVAIPMSMTYRETERSSLLWSPAVILDYTVLQAGGDITNSANWIGICYPDAFGQIIRSAVCNKANNCRSVTNWVFTNITTPSSFLVSPSCAFDENEDLVIAYSDQTNHDVHLSSFDPSTNVTSHEGTIMNYAGDNNLTFPSLSVNDSNNMFVVAALYNSSSGKEEIIIAEKIAGVWQSNESTRSSGSIYYNYPQAPEHYDFPLEEWTYTWRSGGSYSVRYENRIADVEPPYYANFSSNGTNSTTTDTINYNITFYDNVELDSYIFGWNDSGSWVNDSPVVFTGGTSQFVNLNKTLTVNGADVCARFYFNDTKGLSNTTTDLCFNVAYVAPIIPCAINITEPEDNRTYTYSINLPLEYSLTNGCDPTTTVYNYLWSKTDSVPYLYGNFTTSSSPYMFDVDYDGNYTLTMFAMNLTNGVYVNSSIDFYVDRTEFDGKMLGILLIILVLSGIAALIYHIGNNLPEKHLSIKLFFIIVPLLIGMTIINLIVLALREYTKVPAFLTVIESFYNVFFWGVIIVFSFYIIVYTAYELLLRSTMSGKKGKKRGKKRR